MHTVFSGMWTINNIPDSVVVSGSEAAVVDIPPEMRKNNINSCTGMVLISTAYILKTNHYNQNQLMNSQFDFKTNKVYT